VIKLLPKQRRTCCSRRRIPTTSALAQTCCDTRSRSKSRAAIARRSVEQRATWSKDQKRALLSHLIQDGDWSQVLVFTRTKHGANRLTKQLQDDGIQAARFTATRASRRARRRSRTSRTTTCVRWSRPKSPHAASTSKSCRTS
jgi:ATP-dependent RNA helicase RhlE